MWHHSLVFVWKLAEQGHDMIAEERSLSSGPMVKMESNASASDVFQYGTAGEIEVI